MELSRVPLPRTVGRDDSPPQGAQKTTAPISRSRGDKTIAFSSRDLRRLYFPIFKRRRTAGTQRPRAPSDQITIAPGSGRMSIFAGSEL